MDWLYGILSLGLLALKLLNEVTVFIATVRGYIRERRGRSRRR